MDKNNLKILLVDDDETFREMIKKILEKESYFVVLSESVTEALENLDSSWKDYFLVLTDYNMPGMSGIDLLKKIKQLYPLLEVIIITGEGSEDIAVQALRIGAMDYIKKPIFKEELVTVVNKAREINFIRRQNVEYFNEITNIKDSTDIQLESFRFFIKGIEDELIEKRTIFSQVYTFLKQLEEIELPENLQSELKKLLSDYTPGIIKY